MIKEKTYRVDPERSIIITDPEWSTHSNFEYNNLWRFEVIINDSIKIFTDSQKVIYVKITEKEMNHNGILQTILTIFKETL